jgi:hypothetical protein
VQTAAEYGGHYRDIELWHKEQEQTRSSKMSSNPRSDSGHVEQLSRLRQCTMGWTSNIETRRLWHEQQEQTHKAPTHKQDVLNSPSNSGYIKEIVADCSRLRQTTVY